MKPNTPAWNSEREEAIRSLIAEMLTSSARLYHCAHVKCSCEDGKDALEAAPEYIDLLHDESTAIAFIEGALMALLTLTTDASLDKKKEFIAFVLCEAARKGDLLTDAQVNQAIETHAAFSKTVSKMPAIPTSVKIHRGN